MDVYRPATPRREDAAGARILQHRLRRRAEQRFYKAWAEIAASKNLVAILPDLRDESFEKDLDALIAHLTANAASLGIDRERIALYAGSGNVYEPCRSSRIRSRRRSRPP